MRACACFDFILEMVILYRVFIDLFVFDGTFINPGDQSSFYPMGIFDRARFCGHKLKRLQKREFNQP